jgi:hypothetical protein
MSMQGSVTSLLLHLNMLQDTRAAQLGRDHVVKEQGVKEKGCMGEEMENREYLETCHAKTWPGHMSMQDMQRLSSLLNTSRQRVVPE